MRWNDVTIPLNGSESDAVDLKGETAMGFMAPAAVEATTAQLSFKVCDTFGGTYVPFYIEGVKVTLPFAVSTLAKFRDMFTLFGVRYLKIVPETSGGAAVQQTAARTFKALAEAL